MNRTECFNYIEEKLNSLAYRIEVRGKLNLLELNIHSETFFANLCNIVFDLELKNLNSSFQNIEGIDLIDYKNKVVVQVSSTCKKAKIEDSLSKKIYGKYNDYDYKFMSISKPAPTSLKNDTFKNPYSMNFNPKQDIWDIKEILDKVLNETISKQKTLYNFIKDELGQEVEYTKIESNLAEVVNILAKENLNINAISLEINSFAIEDKINFNGLEDVQDTIDDYKIYYHKLDEIYSEFDKGGKNKSFFILQEVRREYIKLNNSGDTSKDIFYKIADNIMKIVLKSKNYIEMPIEDLHTCVDILVVDAFIRCKIFKNPKGGI